MIGRSVVPSPPKLALVKALQKDTRMCMVDGPAGTAKTYLAELTALKMRNRKQIENISKIIKQRH